MKLSHSKLGCILSCPMTYYLNYIEGISKKEEKSALYVGSAVHWGIEHHTEDLSEYFGKETAYGHDQLLSEAMVHGYLKHKDDVFSQILTNKNGTKLTLLDEQHELFITGKLQSFIKETAHDFVGIIDLLLVTDEGFIVIDYKTSTYTPDWNNYLEQIYRYIFLLRSEFPDIPVVKIGIVNIRKTAIRQKKNENESQFLNRMKFEYDLNDDNYVNYHEYLPEELNASFIDNYIVNLSKMADVASIIDDNKMWYINFGAAEGRYGKSDFWDIFYHTPDAYILYKIRDDIYTTFDDAKSDECPIKHDCSRDCVPIDLLVVDHINVLNHYSKFKSIYEEHMTHLTIENFTAYLKQNFITDDSLLQMYFDNLDLERQYMSFMEAAEKKV